MEKVRDDQQSKTSFQLVDEEDRPIEEVDAFLSHLVARGCSPNTVEAYAYDLMRFYGFLQEWEICWEEFTPALSLDYLEHLSKTPSRNDQAGRLSLAIVAEDTPVPTLAPATINRTIATLSSFYDYLSFSSRSTGAGNPIVKKHDPALTRAPERRKPFLEGIVRSRTVRRVARAKTVIRVPRPMQDEEVELLLGSLKKLRDRAMILLMLQGGLRPGEVLNVGLEDVQYGKRRVIVRHREDHPKGARTKSRTERVVDLHEPEALAVLNAYVMTERPRDAQSSLVFLVGGNGKRRHEPLSYWALIKLFERRCEALGIRRPWITPHALRHTHATRMWEGGMRELALQKRLGHASPESTRAYTRVSDSTVVVEYRRALGEPEKNGS